MVQKYGGTSVGSFERIRSVAAHIRNTCATETPIVVVSAMSGQTNKLVKMASDMSPRPDPKAYDFLLASGEQVSCALLSMALTDLGVPSVPMLAFQAGIETDNLYSNARITKVKREVLDQTLAKGLVPVIAGFQGMTESFEITTLGRGGSDTSAVAIAAALKADRCDIYTDVDGVYTCDPRIVHDARRIDRLTYSEMMELASLGAKVLHMRCVELAAKHKVKLRVLSSFEPHKGGTMLLDDSDTLESPAVSALTADAAEALISLRLPDHQAQKPNQIFGPLALAGINVDVIVKTPADDKGLCRLNFTVPRLEGEKAATLLKNFDARIEQQSLVKISIVGIGMRTHSGVASKMFATLEAAQIPIQLITTSEIKVSVLIDESQKDTALKALHAAFRLGA